MFNFRSLLTYGSALFLALLLSSCCPDEEGDFGVSTAPRIELDPNQSEFEIDSGQAAVGGVIAVPIRIINTGNGPLTVESIALNYTAPEGGDPQGTAFTLGELQLPATIVEQSGGEGDRELTVVVNFTRQEVFVGRRATLVIGSNAPETRTLAVEFVALPPSAVADVSPAVIDFQTVKAGTAEEKNANVTNTGTSDLVCDAFSLSGHPDFTVFFGDKSFPVSELTSNKVTLEEPLVVPPSSNYELKLTFAPQTPSAAQGQVTLFCNDAEGLDGHTVVLVANENVPCILAEPAKVDFGGKSIGNKAILPVTISNCGTADLLISGIELQNAGTDFALNLGSGAIPAGGIDPNEPLAIEVNGSVDFEVEFVPDVVNPLGPDNIPIPDENVILVANNSFEDNLEVPVSGVGVDVDCPTAVSSVDEGEQVVPQTTLHLQCDQSFSPAGLGIASHIWEVTSEPDGNASQFIPAPGFANPVYNVNVSGAYEFCCSVRDELGTQSCEAACLQVIVIPDEAIHVELTWTTAGDAVKDESGEVVIDDKTGQPVPNIEADEGVEGNGADMDLHFAHEFATGPGSNNPDIDGDGVGDPWYDEPFDAFWYNKAPNWGTFDPEVDDDPSLDRDDFDGWGPENLNLNIPEEGRTYHIGVHYWNDWCFGESLATVRVYIYGELETEVLDVPMVNRDMWYVGTIPWVDGTGTTEVKTDVEGGYAITPNYSNPAFLPPIGGCGGN